MAAGGELAASVASPDMMMIMNGVFAVVVAALAIPPMVGRALGGGPPNPLPKLAALAPAATVPAVAAVAIAAASSWWLAIVLAVPAGTLVAWQLPPRRPQAPESGQAFPLRAAADRERSGRQRQRRSHRAERARSSRRRARRPGTDPRPCVPPGRGRARRVAAVQRDTCAPTVRGGGDLVAVALAVPAARSRARLRGTTRGRHGRRAACHGDGRARDTSRARPRARIGSANSACSGRRCPAKPVLSWWRATSTRAGTTCPSAGCPSTPDSSTAPMRPARGAGRASPGRRRAGCRSCAWTTSWQLGLTSSRARHGPYASPTPTTAASWPSSGFLGSA